MTSLDSSSSTITATSTSFNSTLQTLKFKSANGTFQVDRTITLVMVQQLQLQEFNKQLPQLL